MAGILKRFKDIMAANINALLDKAEDPEKMIDQYLRDMESDLGNVKAETASIMAEATRTKRGLNTQLNRPRVAFMNPELPMTLPPYQIASGATDILAHMMERYFTNDQDVDLIDRMTEGAMQAVIRAARVAVRTPDDYDAQCQLMWASTVAHNNTLGVGRTQDWGSHQIEHELSAK